MWRNQAGRGTVIASMVVGVSVLSSLAWAGTLEPPASAVDGNGNPVATGDLHSWDKKLGADTGPQFGKIKGCFSERFTCIFPDANGNYTAVRDNETGLVWERAPEPTGIASWQAAVRHCIERRIRGGFGFHLPLIEQLSTLLPDVVFVDQYHPFINVQAGLYWSATPSADDPTKAYSNFYGLGGPGDAYPDKENSDNREVYAWCVRGGQAYDGQDVREVIEKIDQTHP